MAEFKKYRKYDTPKDWCYDMSYADVMQLRSAYVKGIKTPVKRVTVLHTGEELRFSYTGSLPWSGIPGTLWIWAGEMSIHPFATVVKVELEDEITYNLGHGEVVTFNE